MAAVVGLLTLISVAAAQVDDLESLAAQAGVEPIELQGAVNTTGLTPLTYLRVVGELPTPVAPLVPAPTGPSFTVWDRLANCESTGNWAANTGNGYYGGLQFSLPTWRAYGGAGYPHQTSRTEQIRIATKLQASRGWGQWPACSRILGLR